MKKITLILISLALIAACLIPTLVYASETAVEDRDTVHFIAPTAITVVGNYLFVADKIEDNKTAIICFDAAAKSPEPIYTYELDMPVNGLANNGTDMIYAFGSKTIAQLAIGSNGLSPIGETLKMPDEAPDIVDVTYGLITNTDNKTIYVFTASNLYQYSQQSGNFIPLMGFSLKNSVGCLSFSADETCPVYYIHTNTENKTTVDRIYLKQGSADVAFANKLNLVGFAPIGLFALNGKVGMFNESSIYTLDEGASYAAPMITLLLSSLYTDCNVCDVEAYGEKLYVLNSKNQIDIFDKVNDDYSTTNYTTIGSDMVSKTVPTKYTSFTLARPDGYPANIVYKTEDENTSIENIYTDVNEYKEYVILGYEGDADSHYYYVMIGDKFGWVKKSDKWSVVNTQFGEQTTETEAKFVSLNAISVYELPRESSKPITVTQTASTMKTIKVLQKFTEGNQVWYYVEYDEGKTGFVKSDVVGKFSTRPKPETVVVKGERKINSSLFSAVNLYASKELAEGEEAVDAEGNLIKLYSGDKVTLIQDEGSVAYIMLLHSNGNQDFGWVDASRLIDVHQITTNAIVGLSLVGFALVLAAVLVTVYFKRKKRIKANKD